MIFHLFSKEWCSSSSFDKNQIMFFFKEFPSLAGLVFTIYTTINGGQNVEEEEKEKKYVG